MIWFLMNFPLEIGSSSFAACFQLDSLKRRHDFKSTKRNPNLCFSVTNACNVCNTLLQCFMFGSAPSCVCVGGCMCVRENSHSIFNY